MSVHDFLVVLTDVGRIEPVVNVAIVARVAENAGQVVVIGISVVLLLSSVEVVCAGRLMPIHEILGVGRVRNEFAIFTDHVSAIWPHLVLLQIDRHIDLLDGSVQVPSKHLFGVFSSAIEVVHNFADLVLSHFQILRRLVAVNIGRPEVGQSVDGVLEEVHDVVEVRNGVLRQVLHAPSDIVTGVVDHAGDWSVHVPGLPRIWVDVQRVKSVMVDIVALGCCWVD